jgi:glutamyl-tRNA(Gln) amidotransferase subunit E
VAYDRYMPVFETVVTEGVDPTLAASTLASTLTELRRDDVPVAALSDDHLIGALALVDGGDVPAEGLPDLLETLAENPELTAAEAVEEADLGGVGEEAVREAVTEIVERNVEQVEAEGMEAFSALMGECMGALRGKADGDVVSDVLREEIAKRA